MGTKLRERGRIYNESVVNFVVWIVTMDKVDEGARLWMRLG